MKRLVSVTGQVPVLGRTEGIVLMQGPSRGAMETGWALLRIPQDWAILYGVVNTP
jgi:hypothetical protein